MHAQISVLQGLVDRVRLGEDVSDSELRRELEMVGLRERMQVHGEVVGELKDLSWREVILGRRRDDKASDDEEAVREWVKGES